MDEVKRDEDKQTFFARAAALLEWAASDENKNEEVRKTAAVLLGVAKWLSSAVADALAGKRPELPKGEE